MFIGKSISFLSDFTLFTERVVLTLSALPWINVAIIFFEPGIVIIKFNCNNLQLEYYLTFLLCLGDQL